MLKNEQQIVSCENITKEVSFKINDNNNHLETKLGKCTN